MSKTGHPRIFLANPYQEIHRPEFKTMSNRDISLEGSKMLDKEGRARLLYYTDARGCVVTHRAAVVKEPSARPKRNKDVDHVKISVMKRFFERFAGGPQTSSGEHKGSHQKSRIREGGNTHDTRSRR